MMMAVVTELRFLIFFQKKSKIVSASKPAVPCKPAIPFYLINVFHFPTY